MTTENHQVPDGYPHVPSAADIEAVTQTLTGAYPNLSVAQRSVLIERLLVIISAPHDRTNYRASQNTRAERIVPALATLKTNHPHLFAPTGA